MRSSLSIYSGRHFKRIVERTGPTNQFDGVARYASMPDVEVFHRTIKLRGIPCLFEESCKVHGSILLETLQAEFREEVIELRTGRYTIPENYKRNRQLVQSTFGDYIDVLGRGPENWEPDDPPYAGNIALETRISDVCGVEVPPYYPVKDMVGPIAWLGPMGAVTPMHKDSADVFSFHVVGRKRWTLFPPMDAESLYLEKLADGEDAEFAVSDVDMRSPNLELFPKFAGVRPWVVEVDPGECIYNPAGWTHYVETLSPSLTINYHPKVGAVRPGVLQ